MRLTLLVLVACRSVVVASPKPATKQTAAVTFQFQSNKWVNLHRLLVEKPFCEAPAHKALQRQNPLAKELALLAETLAAQGDELKADAIPDAIYKELKACAANYAEWPQQHAANLAWVEQAKVFLESNAARMIASELSEALQMPWPAKPIRVDVVARANWAGAYSTNETYPHVLIASRDDRHAGMHGFEVLLHEAAHNIAYALRDRLEDAFVDRPAGDLWHAAMFFTHAEIFRRHVRDYKPYAEENALFDVGRPWAAYAPLLRREWLPYLQGSRTFDAAVVALGKGNALVVSGDDRKAEDDRLQALGLNASGVVLERPWDEPFTRRSLVVPAAWFSRNGDKVWADSLAKDLPILQRVMSRAYGGWQTAAARGFDWQKWFRDWTELLRKRGEKQIPVEQAFAPMKELMAFQLDNHTNIPLHPATSFGSGSQTALLASKPKQPCTEIEMRGGTRIALDVKDPAQWVKKARRWDGKALQEAHYIALPEKKGEVQRIRCGDEVIAVTPTWRRPDVDDEPNLQALTAKVAWLRLPTFHKRNAQLIEERLPKWPKPAGEKVLVVDLRGNDGGDVALEALSGWIESARLDEAVARGMNGHRHEGASCLYDALRWGYAIASSGGIKPPLGAALQKDMQASLDALAQPSEPGCPAEFKDTRSGWDYRQHRFGAAQGHRRLVVVVDHGCGSDCEAMTMILATLPETVIVGSNTYGVAQYIQPGYSVLPHTRMSYRIALGTSDNYGDGRSFDGYGFDVDVLLADEQAHSRASLVALAEHLSD